MAPLKHKFNYRFLSDDKFVRPYIPITLRTHQKTSPPILALVDSGADFCMFDGELSYLLDIDLTKVKKVPIGGIAGKVDGYVVPLEIGIENKFISTPVIFSFEFSPNGFGGIIGQVGFFDNFVVVFDRAKKRILLK
jgi:hypothetical protein